MKPLTYMNESGSAISQAVKFYKLQPEDILILHDDMDIPVGALRIRKNGSGGGQKGMKSIINALGTDQTNRLHNRLQELLGSVGEEQVGLVEEEDVLVLDIVSQAIMRRFQIGYYHQFQRQNVKSLNESSLSLQMRLLLGSMNL